MAAQTRDQKSEVRSQTPMLRIVSGNTSRYVWLKNGRQGSYQTAREMARLVREAATSDIQLEKFAVQIVKNAGLDSHSPPDEIIDALFRYVQVISYIADTTGTGSFDAIQTARATIEKGYGDCDDLSVLLATLLAMLGFRPAFVLAKMRESSEGFDHIYVEVRSQKPEVRGQKPETTRIALDPTTRKFGMGWESPKAIERCRFSIFDKTTAGLGNAAHDAAITAGKGFDEADKQLAAFFSTLSAKATAGTLTADDYAAAQNGFEALNSGAAQAARVDATGYVTAQMNAERPRYVALLRTLAAAVTTSPASGGAATGSVSVGSDGTQQQSASVSSLLPVALLAGGIFLLITFSRG